MADSTAHEKILKSARILLIEDEYLIASMVQDMLGDLGCACIGPIVNKDEGLHAATAVECDAAILNLIIQGKPAYDIAAILASRQVPFCFASGVPQTDILTEWRTRPYIPKPYLIGNIRSFLLSVLPGSGTA